MSTCAGRDCSFLTKGAFVAPRADWPRAAELDDDEQSGRRTRRYRDPQLRQLARECARYLVCLIATATPRELPPIARARRAYAPGCNRSGRVGLPLVVRGERLAGTYLDARSWREACAIGCMPRHERRSVRMKSIRLSFCFRARPGWVSRASMSLFLQFTRAYVFRPATRRSRGRGGFRGRPFPYYSRRSRGGSRVTVSGCCLPIPLGMLAAVTIGARLLASR